MPADSFTYILKVRQFKHISMILEHTRMHQTYSFFRADGDSHQHAQTHACSHSPTHSGLIIFVPSKFHIETKP